MATAIARETCLERRADALIAKAVRQVAEHERAVENCGHSDMPREHVAQLAEMQQQTHAAR